MRTIETSPPQPTPLETIIDFAEKNWGPQFPEGKSTQSWRYFIEVDGYNTGRFPGVTDGNRYFFPSDEYMDIYELMVSEGGKVAGIKGPFTTIEEADSPDVHRQYFWL